MGAISGEALNLTEMQKKIREQAKQIQDLSKEVNNVEVTLGLNNKKYLQLAEERALIEDKLLNARKLADFDNDTLEKNHKDAKNILMGVLLNKLEDTENSSDILARRILVQGLQKRMADLESMLKTNSQVRAEVELLQDKLHESMSVEKELLNVMSELEDKKVTLKSTLEAQNQDHEKIKSAFEEHKNRVAINRKNQEAQKKRAQVAPMQITEEIRIPSQPARLAGEGFSSPLSMYDGIEYQKKGVTFNYSGKQSIKATRPGRIVYTGALASYGNVLMIDHGNETRTVLLGQFDYSVKNGDDVKAFQVIGTTNPSGNGAISDGKLYFEVRKKNLAQNTYLLLDKNTLAKNVTN